MLIVILLFFSGAPAAGIIPFFNYERLPYFYGLSFCPLFYGIFPAPQLPEYYRFFLQCNGGSRGLMDRESESIALSTLNTTTEVRPLSKAQNPQLLIIWISILK